MEKKIWLNKLAEEVNDVHRFLYMTYTAHNFLHIFLFSTYKCFINYIIQSQKRNSTFFRSRFKIFFCVYFYQNFLELVTINCYFWKSWWQLLHKIHAECGKLKFKNCLNKSTVTYNLHLGNLLWTINLVPVLQYISLVIGCCWSFYRLQVLDFILWFSYCTW